VEVVSPGNDSERRDRELKLKLYSERGVQEYWIIDWRKQQVEVYRRDQLQLQLVSTLFPPDQLTSPLLPGFTFRVSRLFQ
jgi:Uma2 family endonuclease